MFFIKAESSDSVKKVEEKIRERCKLDMLLYDGRVLDSNEGKKLSHYGITDNSIIVVVLAIIGAGGMPGFDYADLTNVEASSFQKFSKEAPEWRVCCYGFNNEGKCQNKECKAYNEWVIIQKGMGEHDVIADDFKNKCPVCDKYVKGERSGFSNCSYRVKGKKFSEGRQVEKVESDWHHVGDCYQLFNP